MIRWALQRTVAPTLPAVTVSDLKDHLRITGTDEDDLIEALGLAAEQAVEGELSRALITQTWVLKLDCFPCDEIVLPRPPLKSVTSVAYTDADGNPQTVSSSDYVVDTTSEPGRIYLAYGESWPVTRNISHAVTITYRAGKDTAVELDARDVTLVKLLVGEMYENRETGADTVWHEHPTFARLIANRACMVEYEYI